MLSKTRCPIGSKKAVFNLLIKGGPAPEKCYARVWPGHRVVVHPMSYLGYSFQARKIKIDRVLFFFTPPLTQFFFWKFYLTLTANNSPLKSRTPQKYQIFGNLRTSAFQWYSIWIWYSI